MGIHSLLSGTKADIHGKMTSEAERRASIRRTELDLAILRSDQLKLERKKANRDLELRKLRAEFRRVQIEIEQIEKEAKKEVAELRSIEEEIRLAKKRLANL